MPTRRLAVYYWLKPWLPWTVRMAIRRVLAKSKLRRVRDLWPIKLGTEYPPPGWPGWPEGKQFAVVLVHDVEGQDGLDKCQKVADLEKQMGFRSGFFFIPEGEYRVTTEFRQYLTAEGFEVGVHDLCHDGKLYASRSGFSKKALRINNYLQEWGAVGFRSGFMHHKLDWIHDLKIQYDSSTFDTDPFEPQPEGVDTIFPFWVPRPQNEELRTKNQEPRLGYAELPYTLPQDSTLFQIFTEPGIGIWQKKLDWVAQHGGMVLVNVHPDYLYFDDKHPQSEYFPITHYEAFLRYIAQRYASAFWNALPREVAGHCRAFSRIGELIE